MKVCGVDEGGNQPDTVLRVTCGHHLLLHEGIRDDKGVDEIEIRSPTVEPRGKRVDRRCDSAPLHALVFDTGEEIAVNAQPARLALSQHVSLRTQHAVIRETDDYRHTGLLESN